MIYQYDLDGHFLREYQTCQEAGKACYIYPRSIEKCCRGETNHSGEYIWKRVEKGHPKDDIPPVAIRNNPNNKKVAVKQLDKDGNLIKEYQSVLAASKAVGIDPKAIRQVLLGRQKVAGGYRWEKK